MLNPVVGVVQPGFTARASDDALIVSFPAPARVLSWAVLNGGFCHADHVINHHVRGGDRLFCAEPERWLNEAIVNLRLQGKVVAMATAVEMKNLVRTTMRSDNLNVTCFATVGCGNALSVGDPATAIVEEQVPVALHTINIIVTVQPGLTDQALVEAIQIVTEARVRALYESAIMSSVSNLVATGTGTDCVAVFSLDGNPARYCGKHTQLGEMIGMAVYNAVKGGLAQATTSTGIAYGDSSHDKR
jgi:adenosylcobinamide amidohydrolase